MKRAAALAVVALALSAAASGCFAGTPEPPPDPGPSTSVPVVTQGPGEVVIRFFSDAARGRLQRACRLAADRTGPYEGPGRRGECVLALRERLGTSTPEQVRAWVEGDDLETESDNDVARVRLTDGTWTDLVLGEDGWLVLIG